MPQLSTGGAETFVLRLLHHIDRDEFECRILTCSAGGELAAEALADGITVHEDSAKWSRMLRLARLSRYVSDFNPDISHIHLSPLGYAASKLARIRHIIMHYQNHYPPAGYGDRKRVMVGRAFDTVCPGTMALACSETVRQQCIRINRVPPDRVRVLHNGVDIGEFDRIANSPCFAETLVRRPGEALIVFVGRLVEQKGLDYLLQALAGLRHLPNWRLIVAGDGDQRQFLYELARTLGIADRTLFIGLVQASGVPALLRMCDIYVQPSNWEGLPLAVTEAMAAQLPVVATDVGGVSEAVREGETGLLVPPQDQSALAHALHHLLTNPAERVEMGRRGRRVVEREFDIQLLAAQLSDLYRELRGQRCLHASR